MTENVESLILEPPRRVHTRLDFIEGDIQELKTRATALNEHMTGIFIALSGNNARLDRTDERVKRIERRLELTDAH